MIDKDYLIRRLEEELARRKLLDFIRYTKRDYQTSWHHRLVAKERFFRKNPYRSNIPYVIISRGDENE